MKPNKTLATDSIKIGILTHPLAGNYGGMLQAYALHTVLKRKGFSPFLLDRDLEKKPGKRAILRDWWYLLKRLWGPVSSECYLPFCVERRAGKQFQHLPAAGLNIVHLNDLTAIRGKNTISWVVGSDQVWRGIYARWICSLPFFFLNFATPLERQNSIAYAASFGADKWEGNEYETSECKRLLADFKAVTVREQSGVNICRSILEKDAMQMPDPTLLLNKEDYNRIIESSNTTSNDGNYVATYILDATEEKLEICREVAARMQLHHQCLMPVGSAKKRQERFPISVPQWLRYMRDCKCLITDSFHGCVFAIIFNKPFVCLGNKDRGNARFESLLRTFNLSNRYISDATADSIELVLASAMDWCKVNALRCRENTRAMSFLTRELT